ncbi:MAG TPA: hypothetical protein VFD38_09105 [Myxococcaceae bacterium]|nr:hypothetical protein [Myxococcaceae bacterium]
MQEDEVREALAAAHTDLGQAAGDLVAPEAGDCRDRHARGAEAEAASTPDEADGPAAPDVPVARGAGEG